MTISLEVHYRCGPGRHAELTGPGASYNKRACKLRAECKAAQPDAEGSAAAVASATSAVVDVGNNAKAVNMAFEEAD